ncbi:hypothetical protein LRP88_00067 [Fusarium phalaenopsidis]
MAKPWNEHRATITKLYIQEGRTLEDVRGIMKTEYNFEASIRSYRQHFDIWGIGKYNCKKSQQRRLQSLKVTPPAPLRSPALSSSSDTGPEPAPSRASQQPPRITFVTTQDAERNAFARQSRSRSFNASSCDTMEKTRADMLQCLAMDNLRARADLRLPLLEAEGRAYAANGWSSTITWLKLPMASPQVRVTKTKLMASLEVAGTLCIYNTLPIVLTNPRYIVETIKNHRFRRNGGLVFQVKWKGFESERHLTWEPEKNLT